MAEAIAVGQKARAGWLCVYEHESTAGVCVSMCVCRQASMRDVSRVSVPQRWDDLRSLILIPAPGDGDDLISLRSSGASWRSLAVACIGRGGRDREGGGRGSGSQPSERAGGKQSILSRGVARIARLTRRGLGP